MKRSRELIDRKLTLERARPWFVTLTTSAAGHGLHPAFSKQPGINDRKSEFTEEIERTDYIQAIICRIRSVKQSSRFL